MKVHVCHGVETPEQTHQTDPPHGMKQCQQTNEYILKLQFPALAWKILGNHCSSTTHASRNLAILLSVFPHNIQQMKHMPCLVVRALRSCHGQ